MGIFCRQVPGPKMANRVEQGDTPVLPPQQLEAIGYKIAAYPLTPLSAAARAMQEALAALKAGHHPTHLLDFAELQAIVGFPEYFEDEKRYAVQEDHREPKF